MTRVLICCIFAGAAASASVQSYLDTMSQVKTGVIAPSLLQHINHVLVSAGKTPDARAEMSKIISDLKNTKQSIINGHEATNKAIDNKVKAIKHQRTVQSNAKKEADRLDRSWVACMGNLRSTRANYDKAKTALVGHEENEAKQCKLADDVSHPRADVPVKEMSCNFATQKGCDNKFSELSDAMDANVNMVMQSLDIAIQQFEKEQALCGQRTNTREEGEGQVNKTKAAWTNQIKTCAGREKAADEKICAYKNEYIKTCHALAQYDTLLRDTKKADNDNSIKDREAEWTTAQTSMCILESLLTTNAAGDAEVCAGTINYHKDVGHIIDQENIVRSLRQECDTNRMNIILRTYSGQTWTVDDKVTSAASYRKKVGYKVSWENRFRGKTCQRSR